MKKRFTAVILAAVLAVSASFTAFAGVWDYYDGYWYFFDSSAGYEDEILTGWQWIDGYCYYLDPDEGGAMAVMTITPDGFPVNEVGRMTDVYGEPYYIPGWGLTSTTDGPADYNPYLYDDVYVSDYQYPLSSIWDLDFYDDIRRHRDHQEPGRRNPDTVIIQVEINGAQSEDSEEPVTDDAEQPEIPWFWFGDGVMQPEIPEINPEEPVTGAAELPEVPIIWPGDGAIQPELPEINPEEPVTGAAELPETPVIRHGGGARQQQAAETNTEEQAAGTEEQSETQVIRSGGGAGQQQTADKETGSSQTERPASLPQRTRESSEGSAAAAGRTRESSGESAATAGRAQGSSGGSAATAGRAQQRPQNGNASGNSNASNNMNNTNLDLLYLLGLGQE